VERHLRPTHSIIERANAAFPNLEVELGDAQLDRSIVSRRIGRYAVTHLKMPASAVELIGQRAVAAGLGNAQAILRCGEPVQLQLWVRIFACNRAEEPVIGEGHGRFTNCAMVESCR
jgi:hypothetical protein